MWRSKPSPDFWRPAFGVAALLVLAGCGDTGAGPRLEASWGGTTPGRMKAPARAAWCPGSRRAEVTATRDDAAIGLVLYPESTLAAGHYTAFDPGIDTAVRPAVAGAARWFTEQSVVGYQGDSGGADVTATGETFDIRFGFRVISVTRDDTVRLTGRVRAVVPGSCPGDSVPHTDQNIMPDTVPDTGAGE